MNSLRIVTLLTASLLLVLSACNRQEDSVQPAAQQPPPPGVVVTRVGKVETTRNVERVGQAEALEEVDLVARVEGYLSRRTFIEGADVRKGDLLFVIEQAPYRIEVDRLQAEVAEAEAEAVRADLDLKRYQSLVERRVASQAELDNARAAADSARALVNARKAELARARLDLSYTEIRAPFDGRIGEAEYSVGDLVNPNSDALATLVMLDPIYVTWEVSEQVPLEYRRRHPNPGSLDTTGFTPRILFPDGSFYDHPGKIDFIDNKVDSNTGTQLVRAVFDNPNAVIMPGQYVTIALALGQPTWHVQVPQSAVQQTMNGYFVMVLDENDNTVSQRKIVPGVRKGIYWTVEEGLDEGEVVIYQGMQKTVPGGKVVPEFKEPGVPRSS